MGHITRTQEAVVSNTYFPNLGYFEQQMGIHECIAIINKQKNK